MRVSYLEIYNESVRDLLGKDQAAQLEVMTSYPPDSDFLKLSKHG